MHASPSILVTGASGGIGRATAIECARRGARLGIHYHRNVRAAEALAAELGGDGHALLQADIADPQEAEALITRAAAALDGLDVLVNNAGVARTHDVAAIDFATWQAAWREIMETNLTAAANLSFCAAQLMMQGGGGRIVNVSSRGAFRGEPRMPWYGASKAGMNAMGQSLAQALAPHGVAVYTVAPGFVDTDMASAVLDSAQGEAVRAQSPLNRIARPDEVAATIGYLAFDAPEFMTGCIIDVNGASYLRS